MSALAIKKEADYDKIQDQFLQQSGLAKGDFDREVSFAIQLVGDNKQLQTCSAPSILKGVLNLAQTGLSLNPVRKQAYLVPRWNSIKKCNEAVLEPSYQGLMFLIEQAGVINKLDCHIVYEGDEFYFDYSSENPIRSHIPYFLTGKDKGKMICIYSIASLSSGEKHVEIMTIQEILEIREKSTSYQAYKSGKIKSCIWIDFEGEMCRKTVIKRHFKHLPKSEKLDRFNEAIQIDNDSNGLPIGFDHMGVLEGKVINSTLSEDEKNHYIELLPNMNKTEARELSIILDENQPLSLDQQFNEKIK